MSFVSEQLSARNLPPLGFDGCDPETRRREIVGILSEQIYGRTPDFPSEVSAALTYQYDNCFGGHARHCHYDLTVTTPSGRHTFPLYLTIPKSDRKVPLVLYISFEMDTPSGFTPDEEINGRGVALAKFCYSDITADCSDGFTSGIAPMFARKTGAPDLWGKLGMWAWAASRALDFLLTLGLFDPQKIAVAGHSRLGKAALWCAAQDTRFQYVFSNNAGCAGDALTRGKSGEDIERITGVFGYWFCDRYRTYAGDAIAGIPFDQHYLLAAIAPRHVAVGASSLDRWADPLSEFLCCHAASPAWEVYHLPGFIAPADRLPEAGSSWSDGCIAFHCREGTHSICRADWKEYLDFLLK